MTIRHKLVFEGDSALCADYISFCSSYVNIRKDANRKKKRMFHRMQS